MNALSKWCAVALLAVPLAAQDVLTQHNDNFRTGTNLHETRLTTANVKVATFGKKWTLYTDGQVVAQPLYVSGLQRPGKPDVNAVVICTMHNTVYVYDADHENPGPNGQNVPIWAKWLGPPRASDKQIDLWSTNDPEWGILSTPVIDPTKKKLYVVNWSADGTQWLHGFNLADGSEPLPPTKIVATTTVGNEIIRFDPTLQKQRPGLLLDGNLLYIAFGASNEGQRKFHGWLLAYDVPSLTLRGVWCSTRTVGDQTDKGGIWQAGNGPSTDGNGNVFVITGDGGFNADVGGKSYGDSFVRLRLNGAGGFTVASFFTPCNQEWLRRDDLDLDLGSSGPVVIPNTNLVVGGGKQGRLYLLDRTNMGGYRSPPTPGAKDCANPNAVQDFQATVGPQMHDGGLHGGHIHGSPVLWRDPNGNRHLFVWGEEDRLKSFPFNGSRFSTTPSTMDWNLPRGMPGAMLSLSANGSTPGSAILWCFATWEREPNVSKGWADANMARGVDGVLIATDASNIDHKLWWSEQNAARDHVGLFAKFCPPTIAGGKVFVATYGNVEPQRVYGGNDRPTQFPQHYYVAVYGLLNE